MNQMGQFLAFLAFAIGVAFGIFFCIEAAVKKCRRWGAWREARRLVRQAEDSEAMKRYRAREEAWRRWREEAAKRYRAGKRDMETQIRAATKELEDWRRALYPDAGTKSAEVLREMQQLNDLMGGKK